MRHGLAACLLALAGACASCRDVPPTSLDGPAAQPKPPAQAPEARTDLYGDPLPQGAVARCGTVRFRAGSRLSELAFSPDGHRIAGAGDGAIYILDSTTGMRLAEFRVLPGSGQAGALSGYIGAIAFTKRGEVIAANLEGERVMYHHFEGSFVVRDTSGAEHFRLDQNQHGITDRGSVALSPDGSTLAIAGGGDAGWAVRLFEVSTGKELMRVDSSKERPCLAFSADGRVFAVGANEIHVWDISARRLLRTFPTRAAYVYPVALSPRGTTVAFREGNGPVRLRGARTGRQLHEFQIGDAHIPCMAFSPDGKALAIVSDSQRISQLELWDTASGKMLWRAEGVASLSLAFSPDGEMLAASSACSARIWDTATGAELTPNRGHGSPASALRFSRDGKEIVSGGGDGVWVWDGRTGRALRRSGSARGIVSFGPGPPRFAVQGWLEWVQLWDVGTGTRLLEVDTPGFYGCHPVVSATGTIATAGMRKADPSTQVVTKWGTKCKLRLHGRGGEESLTHDMMDVVVLSMAFSPDGETLVTANGDGTVMFLDVRTGEEKAREWAQEGEPWSLTFSRDGTKLATGGYGCEVVSIWDVASRKRLVKLEGHKGDLKAVAFSADGSVVATAAGTGTVRLWRADTGEESLQFRASDTEVSSLAFSPDGRYLATGGADTTVLVWDLALLRSTVRTPESGREERERSSPEKAAE